MAAGTVAEVSADPVLALAREGKPREALALCAREHGSAVGRFCMALLGDQAEAEEVLQESLLAAFDGFDGLRGDAVRPWLYGIARRMCARRLAKRARRAGRLRLIHDAEGAAEGADELLERRQRAATVRAGLEELKPSDREALLLRYEAGLSYREVGDIQSIDEATARKRASRALARLRDVLLSSGALR